MTAEPTSPERVSEVLRLCTELSERALDALITSKAVPANQTIALAKAARFLQDHDVDWPPLLTHVMHELADKIDRPASAARASDALPDVDLHGLSRFFAGFRKKEQQ